jgi:hypothetical protein
VIRLAKGEIVRQHQVVVAVGSREVEMSRKGLAR